MNATRRFLRRLLPAVAAVAACSIAVPAVAGTNFGVRTGVYTDVGAGFVGAEAVTSIAPSWFFNPNLEYAFTNNDRDVVTVNGDFHYDFLLDRPYYVWAGAGPAVIVREILPGDHRTDLGLNLVGGIGWKMQKVTPYLQAKVTVADESEAVLAVGIRF